MRPLLLLMAFLAGALHPLGGQEGVSRAVLDPGTPLTQLNVDLWTEDDGLPQNMAAALAQTPDGYLWLGTEEGLVRFDGVQFRRYGPENTPAFTTPWVRALWVDSDGTLWIGTGGGGVLRHRDGTFRAFTTDDGLAHDDVRSIFRDREGVLWVGTNGGGVSRRIDGRWETLDARRGLSSDFVLSIGQDREGAVWIGTMNGLNRIGPDGVRTYRRENGLASDRVNVVLGDRDGSVWAGTTDGGLSRFRDGSFTTYSTEDGLSSDYVTSLHQDGHGALWVGTNGGGLNRIHRGRIESLTAAGRLPGDLILSLTAGREGGLWMGVTGSGLVRLRDGVFTNLGRPEGLSADIALALLEARDGDLWIGTAGGGVNRVGEGGIETYASEDGLGHDIVLSLAEDDAGDIWVGMAAGGLSRIRDGRVRTFGPDTGLESTQITAIAPGRGGHLWLGTPGAGVQRWRPETGSARVYTPDDGLPSAHVTALLPGPGDTLWVGTQEGLARIDRTGVTPRSLGGVGAPSNGVTGLTRGTDGTLWVATKQGLGRIRDDDVVLYGPEVSPVFGEIHAVIPDTRGHLWLSSNDGIARIRTSDLDALERDRRTSVPHRSFGRPDGLRSAEANGGVSPAGIRARDGSIWFPTMKGAVRVEPDEIGGQRPTPTPLLQELVAGDRIRPLGGGVELPPSSRTFELRFTAPTMVAPGEVAFRYMLEGFDETWVEADDRRVAYYTNVPPGSYRFRVATRRGDGSWSESEARAALTLAPRFYETWTFRGLAVLGLVGLAVGGYRLRIRALKRRESQLLGLIEERERAQEALRQREEELRHSQKMEAVGRLAGGVAHDFNNLLTAISGHTHFVLDGLADEHPFREDVEGIREAAQRAAELTQQLLTFSRRRVFRPEVIDLNDLVRSTERMLRRLTRDDVELRTRLARELPPVKADPGGIEQVLINLIVNAEDAMPDGGRIVVATRRGRLDGAPARVEEDVRGNDGEGVTDDGVILSVSDTGTGMDAATLEQVFDPFFTTKPQGKGTGLGLSTVYGIVRECGGEIRGSSEPGEGARFDVFFPAHDGHDASGRAPE